MLILSTSVLSFINREILSEQKRLTSLISQVKLLEMWKAHNIEKYPLKIERKSYNPNSAVTRAAFNGVLIEKGFSSISSKTFQNDAARIWNKCPQKIKECTSKYTVKRSIKEYVMSLPI